MTENPKVLKIYLEENGDVYSLEGIPAEAFYRFREHAKHQFPEAGDDAYAKFLSEVIVAGAGGGDESTSYFMCGVPKAIAESLHRVLAQVGWTWEKFHAYLLHSAHKPDHFRIVAFNETGTEEGLGTFVAAGLNKETFEKVQEATGKSFEQVMATLLVAARDGTLRFPEGTQFLEPTSKEAGT